MLQSNGDDMSNISEKELSRLQVKFSEMLSENDARLFEQSQATYVSLLGDAELPRHWPELSSDAIPDAIDFLNLITSVKNKVPCKYVDNPKANGEVYEGRWRQAFIRRVMQGEVTKLVQVLRRGWAEQINWDEARVRIARKLQDQPTGTTSDYERYLEVYWPNCSISKLDAMVASLNERTYVDPVLENEVRTGTWRNLGVTTSKSDDGSGIITMSLAISHFRLDAFTNWLTNHNEDVTYLYGYSKDETQAVLDAWKAKGHGASVAYRKDEGLIDLVLRSRDFSQEDILNQTSSWDCRYKTIIDYHFGVSDPELYPLTTTPADGVSYDRQLRDNGDGSWDVLVVTRQVQYRDIPFQTSRISGMFTTETRQQLGLTTQTPESMVLESGKVKEQRVEVRDDCSKDVLTNKDTPTHVTVPEFIAEINERETVYHLEEYHDPDAPDIGTPPAYEDRAVLSHNLDDFLAHNFKRSRSVKKFPITDDENVAGITWSEYAGTESITVQSEQADPDVAGAKYVSRQYIYEIVYAFTIKYFRTAQEAADFIGTTETSVLPDDPNANGFSSGLKTRHTDNTASHFDKTGEYEWQATRVWKTYDLRYTWRYDDPSLA